MMLFNNVTKQYEVKSLHTLDSKIQIFITQKAMFKMHCYVHGIDKEISWLGTVEKPDENTYIIDDVFLVKQKVTGSTTDIEEEALSKLGMDLLMNGNQELYDKIKVWGHSHVNMEVFASGTDDETFKEFYNNTDYFIRLICNKKGDMKVDLMDCTNMLLHLNVAWKIKLEEDQLKMYEEIQKEIKENVIEEKVKYSHSNKSYNSYKVGKYTQNPKVNGVVISDIEDLKLLFTNDEILDIYDNFPTIHEFFNAYIVKDKFKNFSWSEMYALHELINEYVEDYYYGIEC